MASSTLTQGSNKCSNKKMSPYLILCSQATDRFFSSIRLSNTGLYKFACGSCRVPSRLSLAIGFERIRRRSSCNRQVRSRLSSLVARSCFWFRPTRSCFRPARSRLSSLLARSCFRPARSCLPCQSFIFFGKGVTEDCTAFHTWGGHCLPTTRLLFGVGQLCP